MKRILLLIFTALMLIFSLSSCKRDPDNPIFATSAEEIFSKFDKKSYSITELKEKEYNVKISDTLSYKLNSDEENECEILTLNCNSNSLSFTINGTFSNVFELNDNIFVTYYDVVTDVVPVSEFKLARLNGEELEDIFTIERCNEGFNLLKYFDGFYYLYYFNSSSLNLAYAKLTIETNATLIKEENVVKASCITELIVIEPLKFYYIDISSLYLFNDDGDDDIDAYDFTFIKSDINHMYLDSNGNIHFYEIKASNYLMYTNMSIKKVLVSFDDENVLVEKEKVIDHSYTLRYFNYIAYNNKIYFVFDEFLGIIEYDCDTEEFFAYYDTGYTVNDYSKLENNLLINLEDNKNKRIFSIELN